MEKTLIIDGQKVKFKSNGATPLRYKAQFKQDFFKEIIKLIPLAGLSAEEVTPEHLEIIDFEVFFNITWILAKSADPSIPEPIEWLEQFDEFPMGEILPELQEMLLSSFQSSKKK